MEARRTTSRPAPLLLGGLLLLLSMGVMDFAHQQHHYHADSHCADDEIEVPHSLCAVLHAGVVVETAPPAPASGESLGTVAPAGTVAAPIAPRFAPAAPRAPPVLFS